MSLAALQVHMSSQNVLRNGFYELLLCRTALNLYTHFVTALLDDRLTECI